MKKAVLFLFMIGLLACSNNPVPKPNRLLDDEVMTNILYDLAILQAADGFMPFKLTENNIKVNSYIYKKYAIDSLTFYQNQRYYAADIRQYKKMYQEVLDRLERVKKENEASPTKNKTLK